MVTAAVLASKEVAFGSFKDVVEVRTESSLDSSFADDPPSSDEDEVLISDDELLQEGVRLCQDDQLLPGVRLLRKIKDKSLLNEAHQEYFCRAETMENLRSNLMQPASEGWTMQGESHGHRDFVTYYKIEDGKQLKCRIESVIESSLFVPFLAVLNETDLLETWFPKWRFPFKFGLARSKKLKQSGRVEQVVQLTFDMPFPLRKQREFVFLGFADEDGAANRDVGVKLQSVQDGFDNGLVQPPEKGIVRMDFEADFMFRNCPPDHVALKKSKGKYPPGEELILLTVVMFFDPNIGFIPHPILNFCTRTALGGFWNMLLQIAEEVRDGKRPAFAQAIESKREALYDWVEKRVEVMLDLPSCQSLDSSQDDG